MSKSITKQDKQDYKRVNLQLAHSSSNQYHDQIIQWLLFYALGNVKSRRNHPNMIKRVRKEIHIG